MGEHDDRPVEAGQVLPDRSRIVVHAGIRITRGARQVTDRGDRPTTIGELRDKVIPAPRAMPCPVHEHHDRPVASIHVRRFPSIRNQQ
jgi:hypothetical protein